MTPAVGQVTRYADSVMLRNFLWDGENIARQTDINGATDRDYTYNPQLYGELVGQSRLFHHFDALGSTRNLTDASQTVTDTRDYKAFGETNASSGTSPNRFWWLGQWGYYLQPDLGNVWVRANVEVPVNGRWLKRDPLWWDTDLYRYVFNDPIDWIDPEGMYPQRSGGPPHPRLGKKTACTGRDSCSMLSQKIRTLQWMILGHRRWDQEHGTGRHTTDIRDRTNELANCKEIYTAKCTKKPKKRPCPERKPAPAPTPDLSPGEIALLIALGLLAGLSGLAGRGSVRGPARGLNPVPGTAGGAGTVFPYGPGYQSPYA